MSAPHADLARFHDALGEVEASASGLSWARERPWRRETHLWQEQGLPVVDLHDLDVKHARRLLRSLDLEALESGAVCFVTGRGRHAISGRSALREAVTGILADRAAREGWELRPQGAGRLVLVTDPERAPSVASGRLGPLFWLAVAGFLALALWLCLGAPGR